MRLWGQKRKIEFLWIVLGTIFRARISIKTELVHLRFTVSSCLLEGWKILGFGSLPIWNVTSNSEIHVAHWKSTMFIASFSQRKYVEIANCRNVLSSVFFFFFGAETKIIWFMRYIRVESSIFHFYKQENSLASESKGWQVDAWNDLCATGHLQYIYPMRQYHLKWTKDGRTPTAINNWYVINKKNKQKHTKTKCHKI